MQVEEREMMRAVSSGEGEEAFKETVLEEALEKLRRRMRVMAAAHKATGLEVVGGKVLEVVVAQLWLNRLHSVMCACKASSGERRILRLPSSTACAHRPQTHFP